jgi:hypothetical protein
MVAQFGSVRKGGGSVRRCGDLVRRDGGSVWLSFAPSLLLCFLTSIKRGRGKGCDKKSM